VLYETTENLSMRALQGGRRRATRSCSAPPRALGALPEALVKDLVPPVPYCVLNSTGSDNISLTTGLGQFNGTVTVVVQEIPRATPRPNSPEVVIAEGAVLRQDGLLAGDRRCPRPVSPREADAATAWKRRRLPVAGRIREEGAVHRRVPAAVRVSGAGRGYAALSGRSAELRRTPTFGIAPVAANEMAIGFPTVKFEISF